MKNAMIGFLVGSSMVIRGRAFFRSLFLKILQKGWILEKIRGVERAAELEHSDPRHGGKAYGNFVAAVEHRRLRKSAALGQIVPIHSADGKAWGMRPVLSVLVTVI